MRTVVVSSLLLLASGTSTPAEVAHGHTLVAGPLDGLHVEVAPAWQAIVIADGKRGLLMETAAPIFAGGAAAKRSSINIRRAGVQQLESVESFTAPAGAEVTLQTRYQAKPSGELIITLTLQSKAESTLWLSPTFTAADGTQPFWIARAGEPDSGSSYVSPGPNAAYAPLPLLGIATAGRSYVMASGSTWEYPLPGDAEPALRVDGREMAAPQVGSAARPIHLQAGVSRSWMTIVARSPSATGDVTSASARSYALELGGQIAVYNALSGKPTITAEPARGESLQIMAARNFDAICFASAYWLRVSTPTGGHSLTPAAHYSPGTWSRDSFWTALGLRGTPLEAGTELEMLRAYAKATPRTGELAGRVPLLLSSPGVLGAGGKSIGFDDESGLYFLIRMYRDSAVLHQDVVDRSLIELVLRYILSHQVKNGRFLTAGAAPFNGHPFSPNGWLDGYGYAAGDTITSNQGIFVVALEAVKRMGVALPEGIQDAALAAYRAADDRTLGYMRWLSSKTYRSPDVLIGEALSLYLFDKPLLEDETVRRTLAAQVWTPYGMQVLATRDGKYVSSAEFLNTTNEGHAEEPAGWYQNGGSWLLWEYLAGYAARRHGDPAGCAAMQRSIAAEVAVTATSKEFKLTQVSEELTQAIDPGGNRVLGTTDDNRQGYGWNAAILAFDENLRAHGKACTGR